MCSTQTLMIYQLIINLCQKNNYQKIQKKLKNKHNVKFNNMNK